MTVCTHRNKGSDKGGRVWRSRTFAVSRTRQNKTARFCAAVPPPAETFLKAATLTAGYNLPTSRHEKSRSVGNSFMILQSKSATASDILFLTSKSVLRPQLRITNYALNKVRFSIRPKAQHERTGFRPRRRTRFRLHSRRPHRRGKAL